MIGEVLAGGLGGALTMFMLLEPERNRLKAEIKRWAAIRKSQENSDGTRRLQRGGMDSSTWNRPGIVWEHRVGNFNWPNRPRRQPMRDVYPEHDRTNVGNAKRFEAVAQGGSIRRGPSSPWARPATDFTTDWGKGLK